MYIYVYIYVCMYVYIHIYIYTYPSLSLALSLSPSLHLSLSTLNPIHTARVASQFGGGFYVGKIPLSLSLSTFNPIDDDDKFTPTKHLTPPPHHSSRPAAAHIDSETPLLHKKKGRIHNVVFFSQFGGGFYVGKIPLSHSLSHPFTRFTPPLLPLLALCSCEWFVLLSCVLLSCACACDLLIV